MISCPDVRKSVIRHHYDLTSLFYRLLWGEHIHHGLWEANESPQVAQRNLTRTLAQLANIQDGQHVLDVGCGLGGSSRYLASELNCQVTGITLSQVQRYWAGLSAWQSGLGARTRFVRADAEEIQFPVNEFDVVWSIECTEHLFDKPKFFQRASEWLKPGGKLAICAWLSHESPSPRQTELAYDICEGFFCPSLGSQADYAAWIEQAGLKMSRTENWSDRVAKTWDICLQRTRRTGMPWLARLFDRDTVMFVNRFQTMIDAFQAGAMQYGCFIAEKPH